MINRLIKLRKPRNLLLAFDVLAIGLLMLYKDTASNRNLGVLAAALIVLLYLSNILLEKVTSGDNYIFMVVSMLISIGAVMNFSIDQELGLKHLMWALIGIACFYGTYFVVKYVNVWHKGLTFYVGVSVLLFIVTMIFGENIMGAKNWIFIGGMSVQPSEFIKIILIFIIACFYYNRDYYKNIKHSSLIMMGIVYMFIGFLFIQRDLGSAVMFLAIFIGIQYVYETDRKLIGVSVLMTFIGMAAGYFLFSHVKRRFDIWLNPWIDPGGQILQSLFAIATGSFTGSGIGLGYPKLIPVVNSDFIFAAICEELGTLTGIGVIMLFILLVYRGFKIALAQRSTFYRILAIGVTVSFGIQAFLAIGGVQKFIPMTGITLPFVSYGGSSLIASFIALAVLQVGSEDLNHKQLLEEPAAYE